MLRGTDVETELEEELHGMTVAVVEKVFRGG